MAGLAQQLSQKRISMVHLLGVSLGGYLAQEFAMAYPHLCAELVLVATRPQYPESDLKLGDNALKKNAPAYLNQFYKRALGPGATTHPFWPILKAGAKTFSVTYLRATLRQLTHKRLYIDRLEKLSLPVTLYHGQKDAIAPIGELESAIPSGSTITLKKIQDGPHYLQFYHLNHPTFAQQF